MKHIGVCILLVMLVLLPPWLRLARLLLLYRPRHHH